MREKKYIKFHNVVCELIEITTTGEPVVLAESMDSTINNTYMTEYLLHRTINWEFATEAEFSEYQKQTFNTKEK